jgi:hypothetical protein
MKASSTFQLPGGGPSISFQVLREKLESVFQGKKFLFLNSISLIAGFILGFAASIGLGGDRQVSIIVGLAVAVGVLLSGSVVGYLVLQTFSLGLLAALAYVAFRINSTFSLDVEVIQLIYASVFLAAPILTLVPSVKKSLLAFAELPGLQLVSVIVFASLLRYLRIVRPSDSKYALSQMYFAEDNAGVVAVLSRSLQSGYSSHASLFGEFFNGIYVAVSGFLVTFGNPVDLPLVAALTHWNITTVFLAWIPLAVIVVLVFSGIRFGELKAFLVFLLTSAILILLFWPFAYLGHSSVISSGLFALCLFGLIINKKLFTQHPFWMFGLVLTLAFIIATTWFPLMPLSGAITGLVFLSTLLSQIRKGNRATSIRLSLLFLGAALALAPELIYFVADNSKYLQMAGGTRDVDAVLIFGWLALLGFIFLRSHKKSTRMPLVGIKTISLALLLVLASNLYLTFTGVAGNSGSPGYGALKYLMTSIAFTLPILWILSLGPGRKVKTDKILFSGLALVFALITFQDDTRPVATLFATTPPPANVAAAQYGVFAALEHALEMNPEQIFCASDYGAPLPGGELNMNSYYCTRWGQSLVGDENGQEWRFVPLGRISEDSLTPVLEDYKDKKVALIRFTDPNNVIPVSDTWWVKYVDPDWKIIEVK